MENKKKLFENLKKIFEFFDFIDFALIFGSYAKEKVLPISDIDIAIHTSKELELLEIGGLISEIEKITQKEVDLVILNGIYQKDPLLAYNIISEGILIFCKNKEKWINFKTKCLLYFFDHQPLYELVDKALIKRIKENKFAKRDA